MKKKPIIGIIVRPNISENNKLVLGVYENYVKKMIANGGIPFIILNPQNLDYEIEYKKKLKEEEEKDLEDILKLCDGILMPGGSDGYEYDYFITDYAIQNNIPLLGICLGMQLMAECLGGKLEKVSNHYLTNHEVILKETSKLKQIYKNELIFTNSRHHYQVVNLDSKYISAFSNDGVIEGLEVDSNDFCIGVEWHPEDLENNKLFEEFIEACINYKMTKR